MSAATVPSELLATVYSAADDNRMWATFCDTFNRLLGAPIMMYGHCVDSARSLGLVEGGWDPGELDRYHAYYGALNPWMHMNVAMRPGMVGVSDHALPRAELFKTEFYNDWLRPQENLVSGSAMICHRSRDSFVALAAACRARGVDDNLPRLVDALEALSPHIMRVIELSKALSGTASGTARPLEASPHAMILISHSGRAGYRNTAASVFLAGTSQLGIGHRDKLRASDEELDNYLQAAVRAMQFEAFDQLPRPRVLTTERHGRCVIHPHVFPSAADREFPEAVWCDPVAGCFVVSGIGGTDSEATFADMAAAFGATAAEARLAQSLLEGRSLTEIAELKGVSRHTVRNQMRALLQKSGTRDQSDFIRLMHRLSSPFSHEEGLS